MYAPLRIPREGNPYRTQPLIMRASEGIRALRLQTFARRAAHIPRLAYRQNLHESGNGTMKPRNVGFRFFRKRRRRRGNGSFSATSVGTPARLPLSTSTFFTHSSRV